MFKKFLEICLLLTFASSRDNAAIYDRFRLQIQETTFPYENTGHHPTVAGHFSNTKETSTSITDGFLSYTITNLFTSVRKCRDGQSG